MEVRGLLPLQALEELVKKSDNSLQVGDLLATCPIQARANDGLGGHEASQSDLLN